MEEYGDTEGYKIGRVPFKIFQWFLIILYGAFQIKYKLLNMFYVRKIEEKFGLENNTSRNALTALAVLILYFLLCLCFELWECHIFITFTKFVNKGLPN